MMNDKKRILIIGGSGLLGQYFLQHYLKNKTKVVVTYCKHPINQKEKNLTSIKLDILNTDSISEVLNRFQPSLVIHCTGLTNVDLCESNQELAYQMNAYSVKPFVDYSMKSSTQFVYISTDHLFSGNKAYYSEEYSPEPINVYGKSKALGEKIILEHLPSSLIIRTNFFGKGLPWRRSFSDWIFDNLSQGKSINVFEDSFFSPISTHNLVELVDLLILKKAEGIFNVCGANRLSKYEFTTEFCIQLNLDKSLIRPIQLSSANLQAKRPTDMSLNTDKLSGFLNIELANHVQNIQSAMPDYMF